MGKLKGLFLNLCLLLASLVVCVALLEVGLRYSAESFPLNLRDFIPKDIADEVVTKSEVATASKIFGVIMIRLVQEKKMPV